MTIATLTGENGTIARAGEAKFKTELSAVAEEYDLYLIQRLSEDRNFEEGALYAGKNALIYDSVQEEGNIYTVLKNSDKKYVDSFEVIKGELIFSSQSKQELDWAQEVGIKVSPYIIIDGELMSSDQNLYLMDEATGTITIPENVTKIGEGAFSNVEGLRTIVIPGSCKEIGKNAFANNETLEKVIIQDGVEIIGENAFGSCYNLQSVEMTDSVQGIGVGAFYYCINLKNINISNNIKVLKRQVFDGCGNLKEITLPKNLERIEHGALAGGGLTYLKIPKTVTYIHPNFCLGRNNLNEIDTTENEHYKFENVFLLTADNKTICYISPSKLKASNTFVIPEGVETYSYTTSQYTNIKKLILPSSLKAIGEYMCLPSSIEEVEIAKGNTALIADDENKILYNNRNQLILCYSKNTNIRIKEGIVSVGQEALATATNAKEIIFPDSLTTLYSGAITRIKQGVNITLGKNVNSIHYDAIDVREKIGNITMSEENERYTIKDNVLYSKDRKTLERVFYYITGEFTVEPNVEKISTNAFGVQNQITNIVLPNNLKEIGTRAFWGCSALTKIKIPSNTVSIAGDCFNNCKNLSAIEIDKKEGSISGAPWGCPYGLRAVKWK